MASRTLRTDPELHFLEWGDLGDEVILLHDLAGRAREWEEVAEGLAEKFHVYAMDLRGHGLSGKPEGPYDLGAYGGDVVGFMDSLGLDKASLVGYSMGARVGWFVAAMHPERVAKLVVEDQHPWPEPAGAERLEEMLKFHLPFESREKALLEIEARGGREWAQWLNYSLVEVEGGGLGFIFSSKAMIESKRQVYQGDNWFLLSQIKCPTLLLCGERSSVLPVDVAQRMQQGIPNCRLEVVSEAGHWIHREQPARYVEVLTTFLQS